MGGIKKKQPGKSLTHGRPPTVQRPKSISRKATKALINSHHLLEKKKAQAISKGDKSAEAQLDAEIAKLGGIERYQQASLQGQRSDRGGDSSRVLMEWLDPVLPGSQERGRLQMLEVGALSTTNECSRRGVFDIQRIDLNSQSDGILQQDFMARPLPKDPTEQFDIISLSLVLNFVPDAAGRGEMLLRTLDFLRQPGDGGGDGADAGKTKFFPSLFLVLPAPCVTNSRYMDEKHLEGIMNAIGYTKTATKLTQRVVYYLWTRTSPAPTKHKAIKKTELRPGSSRNNFAVTLANPAG